MISDAEKVFNDEVSTKSKTARSSHNKNRTGRNRGFFKPMTAKEMEQMNGPCIEYKFDRPYTWDEFIAAPVDVQGRLLETLTNDFNVDFRMLCQMFGMMESAVVAYISVNHANMIYKLSRNNPTNDDWEKFATFIGAYSKGVSCIPMSVFKERKDHKLWVKFRTMPSGTIVNFYNFIFDTFGVSNTVAAVLFGIHASIIGQHIKKFPELLRYCNGADRGVITDAQKAIFLWFASRLDYTNIDTVLAHFGDTSAVEDVIACDTESTATNIVSTTDDDMTNVSTQIEDAVIMDAPTDRTDLSKFLESTEQWSDKMRTQFSSVGNSGEDTVPESLTTNSTNAVPTIFNPMDGMTSSWQFSVTLKGCVSVEDIAKRLAMIDGQNVEITISCKSID